MGGSKYPLDRLRAEWSLCRSAYSVRLARNKQSSFHINWQIESETLRKGLGMELKKSQKAFDVCQEELKRCRMEIKKMAKAISQLQKALDELPPF